MQFGANANPPPSAELRLNGSRENKDNNQPSRTYRVFDEDSEEDNLKTAENYQPKFEMRESQAKHEEFKKNLEKNGRPKDPAKRYKRVLKRVKYESRDSVSSYSSIESEYKTIHSDDDNDRPKTEYDPVMEVSEKSETSEKENYIPESEQHAELPKRIEKHSVQSLA